MVYKEFLKTVKESLAAYLGPDFTLIIRQVSKNNGLVLDGLCIGKGEDGMAPTIYLQSYYDSYQKGATMRVILESILLSYQESMNSPHIELDQLIDFEQLRDKVAYKLIYTASNTELLKCVPHLPLLDMSIVFYLFLEENEAGQMTALIHHDHCESWGISIKELLDLATKNTPRLFPAEIKNMKDVMREIAIASLGDDYREEFINSLLREDAAPAPLFVLTNQAGVHGAACLLYKGILKDFAAKMDSDLVILPSSIHEVLLIPDGEDVSYQDLSEMVESINQAEVPQEDQLSNQVYLYSKATGQLSILTTSSVPVGTTNP